MRRPNQCFVIMPTGGRGEYKQGTREARFIYKHIICAAVNEKFNEVDGITSEEVVPVILQVDEVSPGAITHEMIKNIAKSDLVIVDITGGNVNVFYELGVRHTLSSSSTILMCQTGFEIPFDLGSYSCIQYEPILDGIQDAKKKLMDALDRIYSLPGSPQDSLVFDALGNVSISFSDRSQKPQINEMPWLEYWSHLERIVLTLKDGVERGQWVPDVLFGITNGGMIFGELIIRQLGREQTPLFALWADRRRAKRTDYFSDPINLAILRAINEELNNTANGKTKKHSVLIVDDRIHTGTTAMAAIDAVRKHIRNVDAWYLPMISQEPKYLSRCKEAIIWRHKAFNLSDVQINQLHLVSRDYFPYQKRIR